MITLFNFKVALLESKPIAGVELPPPKIHVETSCICMHMTVVLNVYLYFTSVNLVPEKPA